MLEVLSLKFGSATVLCRRPPATDPGGQLGHPSFLSFSFVINRYVFHLSSRFGLVIIQCPESDDSAWRWVYAQHRKSEHPICQCSVVTVSGIRVVRQHPEHGMNSLFQLLKCNFGFKNISTFRPVLYLWNRLMLWTNKGWEIQNCKSLPIDALNRMSSDHAQSNSACWMGNLSL